MAIPGDHYEMSPGEGGWATLHSMLAKEAPPPPPLPQPGLHIGLKDPHGLHLGPKDHLGEELKGVWASAAAVLKGQDAVPVELKILLDRLFATYHEGIRMERRHRLAYLGWSEEDYERGYKILVSTNKYICHIHTLISHLILAVFVVPSFVAFVFHFINR